MRFENHHRLLPVQGIATFGCHDSKRPNDYNNNNQQSKFYLQAHLAWWCLRLATITAGMITGESGRDNPYKCASVPPTLWRRKYFHSDSVWLLVLVFVNLTLFAMRFICIERGQFCTKCMHINSFKYVQIATEQRDAICFAVQLAVRVILLGCFGNDTVSFCFIWTGLVAAPECFSSE